MVADVRLVAMLLLLTVALTSCLSSRAIVDVRKDLFVSQPLWESKHLTPVSSEAQKATMRATLAPAPAGLIAVADRPGLAMLVRQVFGADIAAAAPAQPGTTSPNVLALDTLIARAPTLANDPAPVPGELAQLPLTRVIVGSMYRQAVHRAVHVYGLSAADASRVPLNIPEKLSFKDFRDFSDGVSRTLVRPYQSTPAAEEAGGAEKLKLCRGKRITLECLFAAYMTAYFNGEFVDRNGGTYSKPKIGMTITNETITSAVAILLEALFDFSIIDATNFNAPIIYDIDAAKPSEAVWLTKANKRPTLVDVAVALQLADPPTKPFTRIIEKKDAKTLDGQRLCVVRLLGGAAGDAAQPLTGMIVRALGGGNLGVSFGLGALGKFSFGDNETLTKLIDTVVENFPRRLTEATVSDYLYGKAADDPSTSDVVKAALAIASMIGSCK